MNIEAIRERVKVERERQRETLAWHENRHTWSPPPLTEQERRQHEQDVIRFNLPF
jgi:hypothetical protein